MSNPHYAPTLAPVSFSRGRSSVIRDEYGLIEAGFDSVEAAIQLLAPKASPTFTGTVTMTAATVNVATQAVSDDSTKAASTAFVHDVVGASGTMLPVQTTHAGKFLYTNGTSASWEAVLPTRTSDRYLFTTGGVDSWETPLPIGSVISAPSTATLPSNWLECDGSSYLSSSYPDLSAMLMPTVTAANFSPFPSNPPDTTYYHYSSGKVGASSSFSTDYGATWSRIVYAAGTTELFPCADGYWYAINSTTMYRTASPATTAGASYGTVPSGAVQVEQISGTNYVVVRGSGGTAGYYSSNSGVSFSAPTPSAGTWCTGYSDIVVVGTTLYHMAQGAGVTTLQKSADYGATWTSPSTMDSAGASETGFLLYDSVAGRFLYRNHTSSAMYTATSDAGPWTAQTTPGTPNSAIGGMAAWGGYFWLITSTTLYRSATGATGSWSNVTPAGYNLASSNGRIWPCGNRLYITGLSKVYNGTARELFVGYTTDGTNWTVLPEARAATTSFRIGKDSGGNVVSNDGVLFIYSSSVGGTWYATTTTTYVAPSSSSIVSAIGSSVISLGLSSGSSYFIKSSDGGVTWSAVGAAITNSSGVSSSSSTYHVASRTSVSDYSYTDGTTKSDGSTGSGVASSILWSGDRWWSVPTWASAVSAVADDAGLASGTWTARTLPVNGNSVLGVAAVSGRTFICTSSAIYYSDNYGVSWTTMSLPSGYAPLGIAASGSCLYVFGDDALLQVSPSGMVKSAATPGTDYYYRTAISGSLSVVDGVIYMIGGTASGTLSSYGASVTVSSTNFDVPLLSATSASGGDSGFNYYINAL